MNSLAEPHQAGSGEHVALGLYQLHELDDVVTVAELRSDAGPAEVGSALVFAGARGVVRTQ